MTMPASLFTLPRRRQEESDVSRAPSEVLLAFSIGLVLRLVLALRPLAYLDRQFIPDDTYFTLGVARGIGHGHGPSIHGVVTSGVQPLLAFVMSPIARFTSRDGLVRATLLFLAICDAFSVILLARLARRVAGRTAGFVAAALWACSPIATGVALGGLETSMALLLGLVLVDAWLRAVAGRQRWWVVGLLSGLAVLARVDLALLVAALAGLHLLRRGVRGLASVASVGALTVLPWYSWCWVRFGSPLPESGRAVRQLALMHRSVGFWRSRALGWAGGAVLGGPVADLKHVREWTFQHARIGPLLFLAVGLVLVLSTLAIARGPVWPVAALVAYSVGLLLFYGTYLTAAWFFRRYLHGVTAVLTLLLAVILGRFLERRRGTVRAMAWALVAVALAYGSASIVAQITRVPTATVDVAYHGAKGYRELAAELLPRFPNGSVVGSLQTGALSYYAPDGVRIVNLDGVVSADAGRAVRAKRLATYAKSIGVTTFTDSEFNAFAFRELLSADPASRPQMTRTGDPVPFAGDLYYIWQLSYP
jgi:hypothetical protein